MQWKWKAWLHLGFKFVKVDFLNYYCESRFLKKSFDSHAPRHSALLTGGGGLVGLALNAQIHDVVPGHHLQHNGYDNY